MYSSTSGNPDLREERGTNYEGGFEFEKGVKVTGAVFTNRVRDLLENMLDKACVTSPGYPMPGRSFKVGLRWAYNRE